MTKKELRFWERFWRKVIKLQDGCWLFIGRMNNNGYGHYHMTDEIKLAHRITYEKQYGSLKPGEELHHKCGVKLCVNPEHLERTTLYNHPGTIGTTNRNKTHCPSGHEYTPENTYKAPSSNERHCKICKEKHRRRWRANSLHRRP